MTFSEFGTLVKTQLTVDAVRHGLESYVDAVIKNGIDDLLSYVEYYRRDHVNKYHDGNTSRQGRASVLTVPDGAFIRELYYVNDGESCIRTPMNPYPYSRRDDLVCGLVPDERRAYYSVSPYGTLVWVLPQIRPPSDDLRSVRDYGSHVELRWDGKKQDYAADEPVPFDVPFAEAVSLFAHMRIEREVKSDVTKSMDYERSYRLARGRLYWETRERLQEQTIAGGSSGTEDSGDYCLPEPITSCPPSGGRTVSCQCPCPGMAFAVGEVKLCAFGDFGTGSDDARSVADLVGRINPHGLLWLGDNVYENGTENEIQNALDPYADWYPDKVLPVWGNHDLGDGSQVGTQYGGVLAKRFPGVTKLNDCKLYYRTTLGVRPNSGPLLELFVLNSGYTDADPREPDGLNVGGTQAAWLRAALADSKAEWKIVAMHRPPWCSDVNYSPGIPILRWPFREWGADMVVAAHGHNYERLLIPSGGTDYCGVERYPVYVSGAGGKDLRSFGTPAEGSMFRYNERFGTMVLSVTADYAETSFVTVTGDVVDLQRYER